MDSPQLPQLIEASVNVSVGGTVQLKQYELSSKYHFSVGGKWSIPEGWDEKDAAEFRAEQMDSLLTEVDNKAQEIVDELLTQKAQLNG